MTGVVLVGPADPAVVAAAVAPELLPRLATITPYAGRPVEALAVALVRAGVDVELVTLSPSVSRPVELSQGRLAVGIGHYRGGGRGRDAFRAERAEVRRLLARTSGDVVHAHWTYEFAWAVLADRRPRAVTIHDAPLTVLRRLPDPYRLVRTLMAYRVRCGAFAGVAVSPHAARRWRREMVDPRSVEVIPNLVAVAGRDPAPRSGGRRLVCVADAGRLKNVRRLLMSFALLRARDPDVGLVLVGAGLGEGDELARWAGERRLAAGVTWCGRRGREETLDLIASADVAVHPSHEESFGLAVAEAMALGVPVVGGRHSGAVPWLLDGGAAGVLVDVTSPEAIATAVTGLLADPAERERLGRAAADRIRSLGAADAVVDRHLRLYDRLLCAPPDRTVRPLPVRASKETRHGRSGPS